MLLPRAALRAVVRLPVRALAAQLWRDSRQLRTFLAIISNGTRLLSSPEAIRRITAVHSEACRLTGCPAPAFTAW